MFSAVKLQVFNPVLISNCNHGIAGKFESRRPLSLRLPDHQFASLSSSKPSVSSQFTASVGSSSPSLQLSHWNLTQRQILTLNFVACAVAVSATWLFFSAIPTLLAFKRAAESLEKLLDVTREELPDTMATVRLSGMEISDLTMELNDLGQEITQELKDMTEEWRRGMQMLSTHYLMVFWRLSKGVEYLVEASAAEAEAITVTLAAAKARQVNGEVELPDRDRGAEATPSGKQISTLIKPDSAVTNNSAPAGVRLHHRAVVVAAETGGALGGLV